MGERVLIGGEGSEKEEKDGCVRSRTREQRKEGKGREGEEARSPE
jgi:hypothetical protein